MIMTPDQLHKKLKNNEVDTLIFDLGNVILDINANNTLGALANYGIKDPHTIFTVVEQSNLIDQLERDEIDLDTFFSALQKKAPGSVSHEQLQTAWDAMIVGFPKHRINLLKTLKERYRLMVLSNTNRSHAFEINRLLNQEHHIADISELVHHCYYSFEVGMRKPEPRIFQHIIQEHNLDLEKTVFFDDLSKNLDAARNAGISSVLIHPEFQIKDAFTF